MKLRKYTNKKCSDANDNQVLGEKKTVADDTLQNIQQVY